MAISQTITWCWQPGCQPHAHLTPQNTVTLCSQQCVAAAAAAAVSGHLPFSGKSFKNLLMASGRRARRARRGTALASQAQQDRFLFSLSPICWDPDTVPELDADRYVV
jgi:hypothetical protein